MAIQNKRGACEEQIYKRFMVVSDIVGREPSFVDLAKYDSTLFNAIRGKYKTLNNWRKKQGFVVNRFPPKYTDEQLAGEMKKVYFEKGRIPYTTDFLRRAPCTMTFRNHFGSWNRALAYAGFDRKK